MTPIDWRATNRANWDERVQVHLGAGGYDLTPLRERRSRLNAIEEAELGSVDGLRVLHLQCHFGHDTLTLAQRGAVAVGLDFSAPAIAAARALTAELGLENRARFVEADLYDAPTTIREPRAFDLVFVTWGAIYWLPDIGRWAQIVAHFLKPGGAVYLAEGHPAALVFDDTRRLADGNPGFFLPYFQREPLIYDDSTDYIDRTARLKNTRQVSWMHPLGAIVTALLEAGLRLDWLREHDAVAWQMFSLLTKGPDGLYRWPDKPWLPLSFSLRATQPLD
ncbi:MAG TPA: class I SAM-dependent methyltransferase [Stellaceae bacterium]|nr:class I SAM-dependent methyltransferase [Stellaceae bacterium]